MYCCDVDHASAMIAVEGYVLIFFPFLIYDFFNYSIIYFKHTKIPKHIYFLREFRHCEYLIVYFHVFFIILILNLVLQRDFKQNK